MTFAGLSKRWQALSSAARAGIRRHPLLFALFTAAFVVESIPIWITSILPQGDIYQHLAIAEVIHNYDAQGSIYPDFFALPDFIKPNLLYYYVVHWLSYVIPMEAANKLLLNAYVVFLPLSILYYLVTFGRPKRLALLSFLLIYSGLFRSGFVGYLLSIPMYFFGVAQFYRWCVVPTRRAAVISALTATTLFFTHAQMYLMYMLSVGLMALSMWGGPRLVVRRLLAPCISLLVFVPWFLKYFVFFEPELDVMGFAAPTKGFGAAWRTPEKLLSGLFTYLMVYFRDFGDDILMLLTLLAVLGLLALRGRGPEPIPFGADTRGETDAGDEGQPRPAHGLKWYERFMPELHSLLLAVTIVALPVHIKNQAVISPRHIPLFALSFFAWLGWFRNKRASTVAALLVGAVVLTQGIYTTNRYMLYERELDGYEELFDDVRPWSRLYKVSGPQLFSRVAHGNVFWHLHYNQMIWKGGVTDVQFAQYVTCPVRFLPGSVPPMLPQEPHRSYKWRYYDYFLVQRSEIKRVKGLRPWLRQLSENRDWILFEKRPRKFERWWDIEKLEPSKKELERAKRTAEKKAKRVAETRGDEPAPSANSGVRAPRRLQAAARWPAHAKNTLKRIPRSRTPGTRRPKPGEGARIRPLVTPPRTPNRPGSTPLLHTPPRAQPPRPTVSPAPGPTVRPTP